MALSLIYALNTTPLKRAGSRPPWRFTSTPNESQTFGFLSEQKKRRLLPPFCLPFTDLTSNQFIDGMKKIFELEPFIKLYPLMPILEKEEATECIAYS